MSDSFTWWGGLSWVRLGEASGVTIVVFWLLECGNTLGGPSMYQTERESIPVSLVSFQHGGVSILAI